MSIASAVLASSQRGLAAASRTVAGATEAAAVEHAAAPALSGWAAEATRFSPDPKALREIIQARSLARPRLTDVRGYKNVVTIAQDTKGGGRTTTRVRFPSWEEARSYIGQQAGHAPTLRPANPSHLTPTTLTMRAEAMQFIRAQATERGAYRVEFGSDGVMSVVEDFKGKTHPLGQFATLAEAQKFMKLQQGLD